MELDIKALRGIHTHLVLLSHAYRNAGHVAVAQRLLNAGGEIIAAITRLQLVKQTGAESMSPEKVDSTSDARTANNVMRHEYRVLNDNEKAAMKALKDAGLAFIEFCDSLGTSRELALAKTRVEEAVMWAVKHITR